ncbi:MAG TPA: hypothetical protein VM600_10350 [Actinomycetota bacterium]|nr:hypothetical protein [Actinomycetota bacterium]
MKRALISSVIALVTAAAVPVLATHDQDDHSDNMSRVSTFDHGDTYRQGSDLAFWGDLAVLGNYDNPGGFRLMDIADPEEPKLVGQLQCPGPQNDVSIWEDLVFLSVDSPRADAKCGAGGASTSQNADGTAWEGIRIVSIDDPSNPTPIAMVRTDCGSHTHTLVPDPENDRVLIYVLSYPLGVQYPSCNVATHRKISVIEVPLSDPVKAKVVSTPSVSPAIGCHDVTVLMPAKRAAAACISESQIWDISDPMNPVVLSHIVNPAINIHHSSTWSFDGKTVVLGDELGGAAVSPGCFTGGHAMLGALWFYDVSDPAAPQQRGYFQIPQQESSLFCTAHNFNTIPLRDDRDVLVSGWYNGGTTVVDFTDPSKPTQLGYYIPRDEERVASWSSYWYNGLIYSNNFDEDVNSSTRASRGFDVFRFNDPVVTRAAQLTYLNPQTQEAFPGSAAAMRTARAREARAGSTEVLGARVSRLLAATGVLVSVPLAVAPLAMAVSLGWWARRRR